MNWKLMNNLESLIDQRNALYNVLNKIYDDVNGMKDCDMKECIVEVLTECPSDFLTE